MEHPPPAIGDGPVPVQGGAKFRHNASQRDNPKRSASVGRDSLYENTHLAICFSKALRIRQVASEHNAKALPNLLGIRFVGERMRAQVRHLVPKQEIGRKERSTLEVGQ